MQPSKGNFLERKRSAQYVVYFPIMWDRLHVQHKHLYKVLPIQCLISITRVIDQRTVSGTVGNYTTVPISCDSFKCKPQDTECLLCGKIRMKEFKKLHKAH